MAIIQSGASADTLTIDAVNKAARVAVYDDKGNAINKAPDGSFVASIEVLPSTLVDGTAFWAMRNTGTKRVFLDKLELNLSFIGTAAASRSVFALWRFSGGNPVGGTQLFPLKRDTTLDANSHVGEIRFASAGLSMAGITFDAAPLHKIGIANQLSLAGITDVALTWPIVLNPGEGLCIRNYGAVVAGAGVLGAAFWTERA